MPKKIFGPPTLKQHNDREHYQKSRERCLERQKEYRATNWDKVYAKQLEWSRANRSKVNAANKKVRDKYRRLILDYYGNQCECCQETIEEFLELDHVNGGGNKHREEVGGSTQMLYKWVIDNNYPYDFRLLCSNCNKARYNYDICPHEMERIAYA